MHTGFRRKKDNTCSCCPQPVENPGGTLCARCLDQARRMPLAPMAVLVTGNQMHAGWNVGAKGTTGA